MYHVLFYVLLSIDFVYSSLLTTAVNKDSKSFFSGDYTLDINPVLLEDDAVFQCQVGAADGVAPIRSRDAILTVNVPPEKPIIINGDTLRTTEDREVEIKCVSRGGKPAATVSS